MEAESQSRSVAESLPVSKDRKEIYLGDAMKRALAGRKEPLTTVVNLIADRYMGMIARSNIATSVALDDVYRAVLAEYRRPLEAADIATFPARVKDWCERNPERPERNKTAVIIVEKATFPKLVALIDRLERSK